MSMHIKFASAVVLCLIAIVSGDYLAGWLTLLLLGLGDQVSLDGSTYWQYWRVIELPDFAPYASRIKIAGGVGFGLPLLIWLGLVWLLRRYLPARASSADHTLPAARTAEPLSLNERHGQWMLRKIQQINEETERELGPLPPGGQPVQPKRKPNLPRPQTAEASTLSGRVEPEQLAENLPTRPLLPDDQERNEMNLKHMTASAALAVAAAGALSGCGPKKIHIQHNPHPKQRYEITMTIQDAPGPFDEVLGSIGYYVTNEVTCVPLQPISGARLRPEEDIEFKWVKTGDNEYKGIVYLDVPLDEDYYGLGVCHWAVGAVDASLIAKGVIFSPGLFLDKIVNQKPFVQYFLKSIYGNPALKGRSSGAGWGLDQIEPQQRGEFFSVTLTAKEAFQ